MPGTARWQNTSLAYASDFWTRHNACPAPPADTSRGNVTTTTHAPCADGTEVTQIVIDGGGSSAPDANAVIWAFFTRHHH